VNELDRWVEQLQEALGLQDLALDVGAILDLARVAAHEVDRPAAPLTTFLVGYAAGRAGGPGNPITVEVLSARASALAESWALSAPDE